MASRVQSAEGVFVPFDTFEKDYDTVDGQPVACGAYRRAADDAGAGEVVRGCTATTEDGAAVLPGYFDMVTFRARESSYRAMLATTPRSRVPETAFVSIEPPTEAFVQRFTEREAQLAPDYAHHREEVLELALRGMRAWRGSASDRMLTRGTFDNFFRGLGIVRDPKWKTVDQARDALLGLLDEMR